MSSVRVTSELTTVYLRQLLCSGRTGRPIPSWPLKWVHSLLFQRGWKPKLGMSKGFVFTLLYNDYSKAWCLAMKRLAEPPLENSASVVALVGRFRTELKESTPPQTHHHRPRGPLSILSLPSESREKGGLLLWESRIPSWDSSLQPCQITFLLPQGTVFEGVESWFGKCFVSFLFVCLSSVLVVRGWHSCLKLNRAALLWVSLKLNFPPTPFFLLGERRLIS